MPLFVEETQIPQNGIPTTMSVEDWLCQFPILKEKSASLQMKPLKTLDYTDKVLYLGQGEYGTVNCQSKCIKFIGSDDATTCQIVLIQDNLSCAVGVAHFDNGNVSQVVSDILKDIKDIRVKSSTGENTKCAFKIHIVGGFVDIQGYSEATFRGIVQALSKITEDVVLDTCSVYDVNSKQVDDKSYPVLTGVAMDLETMLLHPATFRYKGPDVIMRHAKMYSNVTRPSCVYNYKESRFLIHPFICKPFRSAEVVLQLADSDILAHFSTSPHCEPPDFVNTVRLAVKFLLSNKDRNLFPGKRPKVYKLAEDGLWKLE